MAEEFDLTDTMLVVGEVVAERERQVAKGFTPKHDDEHVPADMAMFIRERLLRADLTPEPANVREQFVQVAALAVATVEALDRRFGAPT